MRRSWFRHCAHIICDIFCGWEKSPDHVVFSSRSGGSIVVDLLAQRATLDGKRHEFAAAESARSWLLNGLRSNSIPMEAISEARIELEFRRTELLGAPDPGYAIEFEGRGIIVSGGARYEVPYKKRERYSRAL